MRMGHRPDGLDAAIGVERNGQRYVYAFNMRGHQGAVMCVADDLDAFAPGFQVGREDGSARIGRGGPMLWIFAVKLR